MLFVPVPHAPDILRIAVCLALSCSFVCTSYAALAEANPFPPGDVQVFTDGNTTGSLRVSLRNLRRTPSQSGNRTQHWMFAGAPGRVPTVRVNASHHLIFNGSVLAGESYEGFPEQSGVAAANAVQVGQYRDYAVYKLAVPVSAAASGHHDEPPATWVLDWMDLTIDIGPPPEGAARRRGRREKPHAMDAAHLLNPNIDPAYRVSDFGQETVAQEEWAKLVNGAIDARQPVRKLGVYEPGVYRLSSAALNMGQGNADPARWRVFRDGSEVALLQDENTSDGAILVVPPFDKAVRGQEVFWLFSSLEMSTPPLRLKKLPPHEATSCSATVVNYEVSLDPPGDYHARLRPSQEVTRWFWKPVGNGQIAALDLTMPAEYDGSAVDLTLFIGYPTAISIPPSVELLVNDRSAGVTTAPVTQGPIRLAVAAGMLRAGSNRLGVRMRYESPNAAVQDLLIQKLVARWRQGLGPAVPQDPSGRNRGVWSFATDAVASQPVELVFGETSPSLAGEGFVIAMGGEQPAVAALGGTTCPAVLFSEPVTGPFFVADSRALPPPPVVRSAARMSLFDKAWSADYVAIAHPTLVDAAKPLLGRRSEQGRRTLLIDTDTIYDHFSYGRPDPAAIKQFLSHALAKWKAPRLRDVLLIGEASDYRGDPALLPPKAHRDLVPVHGNPRVELPRGDHAYTTIAGSDAISDIALGRISVSTPDELTSAIGKIVRYENEPAGDWSLFAEFVVDDNEEFPGVAREIMLDALAPNANSHLFEEEDYGYVPNMRVPGRRRSHDATSAILDRFNRGSGVINFFGHGGPNLWTHERLLHLMDMPEIRNAPRLPFISCASCDNAWLDYPMPPVSSSMGEVFVSEPEGGAIGVYAPVAGASPFEHLTLMKRLMTGIYRKGIREQGLATMYSKNMYVVDTASPTLPEQYVLVGDPAVELNIPRITDSLTITPRYLVAGAREEVIAELPLRPEGRPERAWLQPLGGNGKPVNGRIARRPGVYRASFDVRSLESGAYGIAMSFSSRGERRIAAGRLDVIEPHLLFRAEAAAGCGEGAEQTSVAVSVSNPSQVSLNGVSVSAREWGARDLMVREEFALQPGEGRQFAFEVPSDVKELLLERRIGGLHMTTISLAIPDLSETNPETCLMAGRLRTATPEVTSLDRPQFFTVVENRGTTAVDVTPTLFMGKEKIGDGTPLRGLMPMEKRSVSVLSRAQLPAGESSVTLRLEAQNSSEPLLAVTSRVGVLAPADLEFVQGSASASPTAAAFVTRSTVLVRARLRNSGQSIARNIMLHLLVGSPEGKEAQTTNDGTHVVVAEIRPGEEREVEFRWENPDAAGEQKVWLTANRHKSVGESNYANNMIAVPPFELKRIGNLTITKFETPHYAVDSSAPLHFTISVSSDSPQAFRNVDLEYGLKNELTGDTETSHYAIDEIAPGAHATVRLPVMPKAGMPVLFATANANRELEELDMGDNTTETQLFSVNSLAVLEKVEPGYSFRSQMGAGFGRNLELLPAGSVRLTDRFSSSTGLLALDRSQAVSGAIVEGWGGNTAATDNKWILLPWLLQAADTESAGEIRLRIPATAGPSELEYDVYLLPGNPGAGKSNRFELRIGREGDFRKIDLPATQSPKPMLLTRTRIPGGALDITVRQTSGSAAQLSAFEVVPAFGWLESAPLDIGADHEFSEAQLRFAHDGGEVRYYARSAASPGALADEGWQEGSGGQLTVQRPGRFVQWRAFVLPNENRKPTIRDAWITLR